MQTTSYWFKTLLVIAMVMTATVMPAQNPGKKQHEIKQIWMQFEKELGLQSEYSVEMEAQAMGMSIPAKIYRLKDKTRTDMTMPIMNLKMVALELPENGGRVTYSVFPDHKKYCVEDSETQSGAQMAKDACRIEETGTEVFEGVTCKKRRLTINTDKEGTQVIDMLLSPTQKNMPVKMTSKMTMKMEDGQPPQTITSTVLFKNYNFTAPPERLFVIPRNYTKAANMQEVIMSNLFGGGKPQQGRGMTLTPEMLNAARAAQEQNAKDGDNNEATRQSLQNLRRLLGK